MLKKKIWANFQRIIELFTQKIVTKLSKIWVWDPRAEIRDPEKTYSGSRIQGSNPDPQHWLLRRCWGGDPALGWNMQWQDVHAREGNPETPGQWMEQGSTVFLLTQYSTFQYLINNVMSQRYPMYLLCVPGT